MQPDAIPAAARALGLTIRALAAELELAASTVYRYANGECAIPRTVALAVECLLRRAGLYAE
jgi:transcriptional regulator with XRE-family HTH domain